MPRSPIAFLFGIAFALTGNWAHAAKRPGWFSYVMPTTPVPTRRSGKVNGAVVRVRRATDQRHDAMRFEVQPGANYSDAAHEAVVIVTRASRRSRSGAVRPGSLLLGKFDVPFLPAVNGSRAALKAATDRVLADERQLAAEAARRR
jgi:hypothetical protein